MTTFRCPTLLPLCFLLIATLPGAAQTRPQSNQIFIRQLQEKSSATDTLAIFRRVFQALPDEVYVYPSENYYYWDLFLDGIHYKGNIGLFAHLRAEGKVNFGYYQEVFDPLTVDNYSGGAEWSARQGVFLEEIDPLQYRLSFEGKAVIFHLNPSDPNPDPPGLRSHERLVGTTTDESGVWFDLLYDTLHRHFFWVLRESEGASEPLCQVTDDLWVSSRTGFAYVADSLGPRMILCGVYRPNIQKNTWYDGPFDQLPDNQIYLGQLDLRTFLLDAYPELAGRIDRYGHFLDDPESRVALASYLSYGDLDSLAWAVESCRFSTSSFPEFIYYLTQDRSPEQLLDPAK